MVTNHPTIAIDGTPLDPCNVFRPLTITHGRSGISYQPDAPTAEFEYLGPTAPGTIGQILTVEADYPDHDGALWVDNRFRWTDPGISWTGIARRSPRFIGPITGIEAVESLGTVGVYRVRATGALARLGVTPVSLTRPAETDTDRVAAILDAAGVDYQIDGPPGLTLAADTIDRDALAAVHQVCESAAGLFWQARDGRLHYGTMTHREGPAAHVLPCRVLEDGVSWVNDLEMVTNHVTVFHGPEDNQTQETHRDDASISMWGLRHVDVTTLAADAAEARLLALTILARRAQPWWRMPGVIVDNDALSLAEQRAVLDVDVSTGVFLPVNTVPDATPAEARAWTVEGWVEEWTEDGGHLTQLSVTDRGHGNVGAGLRTWAEVAAEDWQHWAEGTWLTQLVKVTP